MKMLSETKIYLFIYLFIFSCISKCSVLIFVQFYIRIRAYNSL
jgi:hypothetical protein